MLDKLLPARKKSEPPPIRVADLDKISVQKYTIVLHKKEHVITPPDIKNWLEIVEANNRLWALKDQEVVTPDELVDAYYDLIHRLCDTITKDDIRNCTQMQIASLWQLTLDMMSGFNQKKTLATIAMQGMSKKDINNLISVLSQYKSTLSDSFPNLSKNTDGD